jgi:type IV secretion system protein VirD4
LGDGEEVKATGLLGPDGVVLGRLNGNYLRHHGPEHVPCFAPTRSGKGVALVVPSQLTWPGSRIVHDIKGENWGLTAGFRPRLGRVLLFDPTNPNSDAYNPLLEVRRGEREVRDVQNVADVLVDPEDSFERRNHREKTSHSVLVGAILHVRRARQDACRCRRVSDPKPSCRPGAGGADRRKPLGPGGEGRRLLIDLATHCARSGAAAFRRCCRSPRSGCR